MAYFNALIEIPYTPPGTTTEDIYKLLNDELLNGIYQITEETVRKRGKYKKFTIEASCRIHTAFLKEADKNGRIIRYMPYNGKEVRLRMWSYLIK